ncbi:ABC transporter permease [Chelativorans sp. Marseille-P2723]|uniref:ABC transporter permease n=1 Tax=Chelativorans sp. Marseille-P2723 TaxID=2709133 RepID=UPI001570AD88|nr:ABC transporter permease [Chelativorans sp. Marseille-P2723]
MTTAETSREQKIAYPIHRAGRVFATKLASREAIVTCLLLLPAVLFLTGGFVFPLIKLFTLSLESEGGTLSAYREIIGSEVFRAVFVQTLILAVTVTVISVLLAYPAAYLLSRLKDGWLTLAIYCVLVPFWISVLVRTFSWMLLLERNGPVNSTLMWLGVTDQPLKLLFNDLAVHLGMIHVLLPYAVLPIYASLLKLDPRLLQASNGLGASGLQTFLRVTLPLTAAGVAAGATFVFLLSLGFYITPMLLGGFHNLTVAMLIDNFVNERLVWPLAAAASFILLFIILVILAVAARFLSIGQMLVTR